MTSNICSCNRIKKNQKITGILKMADKIIIHVCICLLRKNTLAALHFHASLILPYHPYLRF